jgi:uncharacterized DUF497 family protein
MHETADHGEDRFMVIAGAITGTTLAVVFLILATFALAWHGVKWMMLRPLGLYQPAPPI